MEQRINQQDMESSYNNYAESRIRRCQVSFLNCSYKVEMRGVSWSVNQIQTQLMPLSWPTLPEYNYNINQTDMLLLHSGWDDNLQDYP